MMTVMSMSVVSQGGPSLTEIAALVALVEAGSFTAAARALHLSQPGFSARVARLERCLGVELVDRGTRRLTLTPHGRAFLPWARWLVEGYARGQAEARQAIARTA